MKTETVRLKLTIAYDGTNYAGWQVQKTGVAVQELIEKALQTDIHQLIPSDYESVQRALLDGKPIQTGTSVGKQLLQMSQKILGRDTEKKKPEKSRSTSGLSGLFSLFSRGT